MGQQGLAALHELAERARPVALAREQVLPVLAPLEPLFPAGLRRGSTVAVSGPASTSLALAVVAGPSGAGSWVAFAGIPTLGLAAAAEAGVALERTVLVAEPPSDAWATVVATLVDAFDVVLVRASRRVGAADARRLTARARERGAALVLLAANGWPEAPDVRLRVTAASWEGLGQGHGHLRARRVNVEGGGRRGDDRPRRAELWLPGPDGGVDVASPLATVRPLRDVG